MNNWYLKCNNKVVLRFTFNTESNLHKFNAVFKTIIDDYGYCTFRGGSSTDIINYLDLYRSIGVIDQYISQRAGNYLVISKEEKEGNIIIQAVILL